jgi:hypothetical protein
MDAEVRPDPVILGDTTIKAVTAGATNLGDTTIEAAMDVVNRTLSPQTTSAERCLKCFTERITKRRQLPLLELSGDDTAYGKYAPPTHPCEASR